ncbi:MAG: type II secretion system F family protein [Phycisphaerae bacterium]|nr:type II secretion system F family protein [Phycisphaerae bacterium]
MPKYKYEVQASGQDVTSGVVEAASLMEASDWVRAQGGYLLNIVALPDNSGFMSQLRHLRMDPKPGLKDLLSFTKQLSVMIKAGISIRDAVEGIAAQVENMRFRKILEEIKDDVESGVPFSGALAKHPKLFSPLYVNMVRASEMSGTFSHMLNRIAAYLTQQSETRRMVIGAMVYPSVLFCMSIGAVTFLLTWVLPRFLTFFAGKEHLLPKPTLMVMAISNFLTHQWYFLIAGIAVVVTALSFALRTPQGRWIWDGVKLRIPIFKRMFRALYITRSLQTMGELLTAGVPILETLDITADVAGNQRYMGMWKEVRDSVQQGNQIAQPLHNQRLLPPNVVQMIGAGENSGNLGPVLQDISDFYQKELKDTIKAVTSLIEPFMIVFMGVVIGAIAMSIMLPAIKISSIMRPT